jgi:WD40 repeat protein
MKAVLYDLSIPIPKVLQTFNITPPQGTDSQQKNRSHDHDKHPFSQAVVHPSLPYFATTLPRQGNWSICMLHNNASEPTTTKHPLDHHHDTIRSIKFHPTLPLLATASIDMTTYLYDISTWPPTIKHHLRHHTDEVNCVAFHPTLPFLSTCSEDKTIIIYNLDKGNVLEDDNDTKW